MDSFRPLECVMEGMNTLTNVTPCVPTAVVQVRYYHLSQTKNQARLLT